MPRFSKLCAMALGCALAIAACRPATAQASGSLSSIGTMGLPAQPLLLAGGQAGNNQDPLHMFSIRGGAMVSPRGAGLAGVDFELPQLSMGSGWHGRLDGDVIFAANFGGIDTIIPITFDQLYWSPNSPTGHNIYFGGGIGAILGGPVKFDGKLIVGAELTSRLDGEFNVHFNSEDTLLTLLVRIHL